MLSVNPPINFPDDMVEKINKYDESIIISPNKPFLPKRNKFGFVEVPYVKTMLFAGDTEDEFLGYSWSCTSVSSTQMTFQLVFEFPLEISMQEQPEQIQFEFHI